MQLGACLRLIRWKNLGFLIYLQVLLKYVLFSELKIHTTLTFFQFSLLLGGIVFIMAAGYIINDIFDLKTDLINKPLKRIIPEKISVEQARFLYKSLNTMGITLGIILSLQIERPGFSLLFILSSILLYYYSKLIKKQAIMGNLLVSLLIAFSLIILFLAEFRFEELINLPVELQRIGIFLVGFAFMLNFIREIIKDIEDINGDLNTQMGTLPILFGIERTKRLAACICFISVFALIYFCFLYRNDYVFALSYLFIAVIIPLMYVGIQLFSAKSKIDFQKLSRLVKIIMFLGINVVLLINI
jgi:4-hydroxybenzoate polyprenyltransferase